jgi:CheY-like chemotaxis protein
MQEIAGLKVLVVEDEPIVAMMLEDMLEELGCELAGSAASVEEGLRLAALGNFDVALLDVNLNGRRSDPIAEALVRVGTPFVYATGYGAAAVPPGTDAKVLQKPYTLTQLGEALGTLGRA